MNVERAELERLLKKNGGLLKVDMVVDAARNPRSPLHSHFEWDDTVAAEQYRREQARYLIQKCNITIESREAVVVRAFVSLPSDRSGAGGYRLTEHVINQPDLRAQLFADINAQIKSWSEKAKLFAPDVMPWLAAAPSNDIEMAEVVTA
jgi:hypothetical protein